MNNAIIADNFAIETCELYREANKHIKLHESKKEIYKKDLYENYFNRGEILVFNTGIVLATAKLQTREGFDSKRFKEDHPELYEQYKTETVYQPLLVK